MKKSKVIVPALALLAVSTVASISGTVAWFTTNTKANTSFSEFSIKKLSSELSVSTVGVVGVTATENAVVANKVSGSDEYVKLTHASFNSKTGDVYTRQMEATENILVSGKTSKKYDNLVSSNTKLIADTDKTKPTTYYVFVWTSTFSFDAVEAGIGTANLYFSNAQSEVKLTDSGTGNVETNRGFRMSMINQTADSQIVWSPMQKLSAMEYKGGTKPEGADQPSCYASGTGTTKSNYAATEIIYEGDTSVPDIESTAKGSKTRKDCLGQFTSTVKSIAVTFVAWFEGYDPNIVNETVVKDVAADLSFYVRTSSD